MGDSKYPRQSGRIWIFWLWSAFAVFVVAAIAWGIVRFVLTFDSKLEFLRHPIRNSIRYYDDLFEGLGTAWSTAVELLRLPAWAVASCIALSALVLALAMLWAALMRREKARVFISYQHSRQEQAKAIVEALRQHNQEPRFIPFADQPKHDQLLDSIQDEIRRCHFVVCLPGPDPSFVQNEVFAAIQRTKPLMFLLDYPDGELPNTAQKSYPVLMSERASEYDYGPLRDLISFLYCDWRATWHLYLLGHSVRPIVRRMVGILTKFVFLPTVAILLVLLMGMTFYVEATQGLVPTTRSGLVLGMIFVGMFCLIAVSLALMAILFLLNGVSGLLQRRFSMRVVRRQIANGGFAFEALNELLASGDALLEISGEGSDDIRVRATRIVHSLWREAPLANHEAQRIATPA